MKQKIILAATIICLIIATAICIIGIISEERPMKLKANVTYHDKANMEMFLGGQGIIRTGYTYIYAL